MIADAMKQREIADKWLLAKRMLPVLKETLTTIRDIEFDQSRWDYLLDVIENYLPKAITSSDDLSDQAQTELLSYLSALSRSRNVLMNRARQKQLIGLTVSLFEFQTKVFDFLGVTSHGVPVTQSHKTNTEVIVVSTDGTGYPN